MKIIFNYPNNSSATSPDFPDLDEEAFDYFYDEFLGGINEDNELFWNSDISGSDKDILVSWFSLPNNPQKAIDNLSLGLKTNIPPYTIWKIN